MKNFILFLVSLLLGLCFAAVCSGQTATIIGPKQAEIGRLVVLDSSSSDKTGAVDWGIDDCETGPSENVSTFVCDDKLVLTANKPGKYTIELIVFKEGIDKTTHVVEFVGTPTSNPEPDPEPEPEPEPEPGDFSKLTEEIRAISAAINDPSTALSTADVYRQAISEATDTSDLLSRAKRYRQSVMQSRADKTKDWTPFVAAVNKSIHELKPETFAEMKKFLEAIASGLKTNNNFARQ